MRTTYYSQLDTEEKEKAVSPKVDKAPVSGAEKLVRKEIDKLNESAEEIRKLKEQVEKSQRQES